MALLEMILVWFIKKQQKRNLPEQSTFSSLFEMHDFVLCMDCEFEFLGLPRMHLLIIFLCFEFWFLWSLESGCVCLNKTLMIIVSYNVLNDVYLHRLFCQFVILSIVLLKQSLFLLTCSQSYQETDVQLFMIFIYDILVFRAKIIGNLNESF